MGGRRAGAAEDNGQRIEESIAYMLRHLDQPLNVPQLASRARLSASHYFAVFKGRTGCSPIDYFIGLRMGQACRLLAETAFPVKDIAARLGYDDPFYFSRLFKSVHAVAPTEYRTAAKGGRPSPPRGQERARANHSFLHSQAGGGDGRLEAKNNKLPARHGCVTCASEKASWQAAPC
jgi:AraC-like DNA-binding protein